MTAAGKVGSNPGSGGIYSWGGARHVINRLLRKCGSAAHPVRIEFFEDGAKIRNSYLVSSRVRRMKVCAILARTEGFTARTAGNYSAEWVLHNICYRLRFKRSSAVDVDLDVRRDRRASVRVVVKVFDILGIW